MKKIISFALVLAMLLTMLVGCGSAGKTLDKAGTYTGEYDELTITAADTVLENATASKIVIAKSVGDGDVTLKNVTVDTLEVYGGGENSIHLLETAVKAVVSHKEEGIVRIVAEAMTSVETFDSTNTIVEVAAGANVGTVTAKSNTTVTVFPEATAAEVVVADTTAVADIQGETAKVTVDAPAAVVEVAETAKVEEVKVTEKAEEASLTIKGEVAAVAVEAPKTAVAVAETATVAEVKVAQTATAAKTEIAGTVTKMETAAAQTEVKVAQTAKVEEVKVAEQAEGTKTEIAGTVAKMETAAAKTETTVTETAKVEEVKVTEKANDTALVVEGTVTKVDTEATTTVAGNGTVEKVETSNKNNVTLPENSSAAQGTTVTQKPNTTTPAPETTPTQPTTPAQPETKPEETTPSAPSHSHSYTVAGAVIKAATCTEAGSQTYKCSGCSATTTKEIAATGHTVTATADVDATCTTAGNSAYWTCGTCGKFFSEEACTTEIAADSWVISALGHDTGDDNKCDREGCGWYVVDTQEKLEAVISNAKQPVTVELSGATYKFPTASMANKDITFKGTENTAINLQEVAVTVGTVTFDGVKVEFANSGYKGLQHSTKVVYKNCTITGLQFLYATDVEFINCTLTNKNDYSVWTYGAKNVTFTGCTFNSGGKAVLVYIEKAHEATIKLTNCVFNDDDTLNTTKGAVEIGESAYGNQANYTLIMDGCTVNGFAVNNEGTTSTSTFWGNKNDIPTERLSVTIDGVKAY